MSWYDARNYCASRGGGDLAEIRTKRIQVRQTDGPTRVGMTQGITAPVVAEEIWQKLGHRVFK